MKAKLSKPTKYGLIGGLAGALLTGTVAGALLGAGAGYLYAKHEEKEGEAKPSQSMAHRLPLAGNMPGARLASARLRARKRPERELLSPEEIV